MTTRGLVKRFAGVMGLRPAHFIAPTTLGLLAASLDGLAVALLVPLAKGVAGKDFKFVWGLPGFRQFAAGFPGAVDTLTASNRAMFLLIIGTAIACKVVRMPIMYVFALLVSRRTNTYAMRLRTHMLDRYLSLGKRFFDRTSQGQITEALTYPSAILQLLNVTERIVGRSLRLIVHGVVLVGISWRLSLVIIVTLPGVHYTTRAIVRRIGRLAERTTEEEIGVAREVFNLLSSIPLVKAYSREAEALAEYSGAQQRLRDLAVGRDRMKALAEPTQQLILLSAMLLTAIGAVVFATSDSTVELATFAAFLLVASLIVPIVGWVAADIGEVVGIKPRLERFAEVFDDRGKVFVEEGEQVFSSLEVGITVDRLGFAYDGETPVFEALSLFIPAHRTTAIVGATISRARPVPRPRCFRSTPSGPTKPGAVAS